MYTDIKKQNYKNLLIQCLPKCHWWSFSPDCWDYPFLHGQDTYRATVTLATVDRLKIMEITFFQAVKNTTELVMSVNHLNLKQSSTDTDNEPLTPRTRKCHVLTFTHLRLFKFMFTTLTLLKLFTFMSTACKPNTINTHTDTERHHLTPFSAPTGRGRYDIASFLT